MKALDFLRKICFPLAILAMLAACSGDDSTTINIEAPPPSGGDGSSGGGDSGGGDSGGETPATCPEGTT
ncbi:MAG: hypothetical protein VW865_09725, partial [Halieaceae bacterium]